MIMIENYKATLDIITPVIINTGETFDFCELCPIDKLGTGAFRSFQGYQMNLSNLFEGFSYSEKMCLIDEMTTATIKRDNEYLSVIRNRIISNERKKKIRIPCRFLPQAAEDLSKKPLQKVDKVMQQNISDLTYIPGSSVKGSIRTAVLEGIRKQQDLNQRNNENCKDFEMRIMSDGNDERFSVQKDPFKYLRISDFTLSGKDGMSYIGKIDSGNAPIYSAMTSAYVFTGEPIIATGTVSIDTRFYKLLNIGNDSFKSFVSKFYEDSLTTSRLEEKIKNEHMKPAVDYLNNSPASSLFFRLGHYIGIKNYTFDVVRYDNRKNPNINIEGGRVPTIESCIVPGICLLTMERI